MLSIRSLPLIVIALILYNVVAFLGGQGTPEAIQACGSTAPVFCKILVSVPMLKGGVWKFTIGDLILLFSTLGLWYHALAGVRHLIWDNAAMLDMQTADKLSWAVIAGSVLLTLITIIAV